jgi:2-oxoglutarate ferredoxin oxidoreductase subunit delta
MTAKRQKKTKSGKAAKSQKKKPVKAALKEEEPKEKFIVEFYRDWCKGCGICAAFCPAGAISMNDKGEPEVSKPELCTGCTWCEIRCPDFAVQVKEKKEEEVCEA